MMSSMEQIIPDLRDAVGPVILISGIGLLLLTMTNRLGRAIDRARILKRELAGLEGAERQRLQSEINVLFRRARIIRVSILFAVFSALLAVLLMSAIFIASAMQWRSDWFLGCTFIGCMGSLCISLIAFIADINLSLHALKLELDAPGKAAK